MPHIAIISGSQRVNSQSVKVANYIQQVLNSQPQTTTWLTDLGASPLPFYNSDLTPEQKTTWNTMAPEIERADGYVIITPEWNGGASAAIRNFFLFVGTKMVNKPGLIVSVSSGRGGAYPVQELRAGSYKNTSICYIPEHIIVRDVKNVLNTDPDENNKEDIYIRARIEHAARVLLEYSIALKLVRDSNVFDKVTYPNGM